MKQCFNCKYNCTAQQMNRNKKEDCPYYCGRVTIREIAEILKVSIRTVFRSLNRSDSELFWLLYKRGYIFTVKPTDERNLYYLQKFIDN